MAYRVIQWATGALGAEAVAGIVGHPDLELVGAWVHSEEKDGRDVGEICGLEPLGVLATRDKVALLSMDVDCVCYMAGRAWLKDPMETVSELSNILRSGKNVVNVSWPALVYPSGVSASVYEELQEACLAGGSTLYTGGIDPGYGNLGLTLAVLNVTRAVRSVRTYEIVNYADWDHPELVTHMGFGQPDVEKCTLLAPGVTAGLFGSSLVLVADAMGVTLDEIIEDHDVIYADEAFDVAAAHIAAGTISGMRFEVKGMVDGFPMVVVEHVTKLRAEDFPDVDFEGRGIRRVVVEGEPGIRLDFVPSSPDTLNPGYISTAMSVVNPIPQVCDAEPGVLSILDLLPYPSKNVLRR
jgi:4-hydroxy-tetrahydrodipicolinate reductase